MALFRPSETTGLGGLPAPFFSSSFLKIIYLFISGCAESSLLWEVFSSCSKQGLLLAVVWGFSLWWLLWAAREAHTIFYQQAPSTLVSAPPKAATLPLPHISASVRKHLAYIFLNYYYYFYCSGFCHTSKWNSHGFTCVPHPDPPSHLPLHLIPLGLPSAPGPSACLMHPTWAGDLFHPR